MSTTVLLNGLLLFGLFSWAVKFHFTSSHVPPGMKFISFVSVVNISVFAFEVWRHPQGTQLLVASLLLQTASAALFLWTVSITRTASLKLAFDETLPDTVVQTGPYRYVRHPFYLSYIIFWLGCALATLSILNIAMLVILAAVYVTAAAREENAFKASTCDAAYAAYRRATPTLWSWIGLGKR